MGSNGNNFKVNFLKNCSVSFFLFFPQHIYKEDLVESLKGLFFEGQNLAFLVC